MSTVCAAIPIPEVSDGEALQTQSLLQKERQLRLDNGVLALDVQIKPCEKAFSNWRAFLSASTLASLRRRTGAGFVLRSVSDEQDFSRSSLKSDGDSSSPKGPSPAFLRVCAFDSDTLLRGAAAASEFAASAAVYVHLKRTSHFPVEAVYEALSKERIAFTFLQKVEWGSAK